MICSTTHTENVVAKPNTAARHSELVLVNVSNITGKKRLMFAVKFIYRFGGCTMH